jgi:hypothetical protein
MLDKNLNHTRQMMIRNEFHTTRATSHLSAALVARFPSNKKIFLQVPMHILYLEAHNARDVACGR